MVIRDLRDVFDDSWQPAAVFIVVPEVVPVSATPGAVVSLPDKPMSVTPVVIAPVSHLPDPDIRVCLHVVPRVVTGVLVKCDRILLPNISSFDEVDVDVLPVVIMAVVHAKGITSLLLAIPKVPGKFQEVAAFYNFEIDWSLRIERRTAPVIVIGGQVWVAVITC